jgi:hypothetical protein
LVPLPANYEQCASVRNLIYASFSNILEEGGFLKPRGPFGIF